MSENHHDDEDDTRPAPYFQAPPLPPETYGYLIHALLSLQGSAYPQNHPPAYPYQHHPNPLPYYNYSWPPSTAPPILPNPIAGLSVYQQIPSLGAVPGTPSMVATSQEAEPEGTEDATLITEDKRRRNTAASARFRVKKKLKTHNLERTVSDLTGRTEELEREAAELRRENAWLKEIVLLKGRNLATVNAPVPVGRRNGDKEDERTDVDAEPESTAKRRGKGKEKESS